MSVMSVAKRPGALVRPLRAGHPGARSRPREFRGCEPSGAELESEARHCAESLPGDQLAGAQQAVLEQAVMRQAVVRQAWAGQASARRAAARAAGRPRLAVVPAQQPGVAVAGPATARRAPAAPSRSVEVPAPGLRLAAVPFAPARLTATPAGAPRVAALLAGGARPAVVRAGGTRVAPVPARGSARPRGKVRLTRRGRLVLWMFAMLAAAAALTPVLLTAAAGAQAANHGLSPAAVRAGMRAVVVKPGQSLWSIALQAEPNADPRVVSQQIIEYNVLGSEVVVPGERLWVPKN